MDDFEGVRNLFHKWGWVFIPGHSLFRWGFRWLSSGQLRLREGWLSVWKAQVKCVECFWAKICGWKALESEIRYSVNGGLREKIRSDWGPFSACLNIGTHSPIYREGARMVLGGKLGALSRMDTWVESGLELTWGTFKMLCFVAICIIGRFVLVPSMDLEQPREMNWPTANVTFCHFEKILFLHMGSGLALWGVLAYILTLIHD